MSSIPEEKGFEAIISPRQQRFDTNKALPSVPPKPLPTLPTCRGRRIGSGATIGSRSQQGLLQPMLPVSEPSAPLSSTESTPSRSRQEQSSKTLTLMEVAAKNDILASNTSASNQHDGKSVTQDKNARLKRGRDALSRATRAIVSRLRSSGGSSNSGKNSRKESRKESSLDDQALLTNNLAVESQEPNRKSRISGHDELMAPNIKVPKIKKAGQRKAPGTPEKTKGQRKHRSQLHDPFSDDQKLNGQASSPPMLPKLRKPPLISNVKLSASGPFSSSSACSSLESMAIATKLSDLTIKNDLFSSSPIAFATPRYHLAPHPLPNGRHKLRAVHNRSISTSGASAVNHIIASRPAIRDQVRPIAAITNLKRKKARDDLRGQHGPSKKTKVAELAAFPDTSMLEAQMQALNTGRQRSVLTAKEGIRVDAGGRKRFVRRGSAGMRIFQLPKGKELEEEDVLQEGGHDKRQDVGDMASVNGIRCAFEQYEAGPSMEDSLSVDELQLP